LRFEAGACIAFFGADARYRAEVRTHTLNPTASPSAFIPAARWPLKQGTEAND
jgi:hypothetical protein